MKKFKAIVVDDEQLARKAILSLIREYPAIQVVGEAGDGREAVAQAIALNPDVILMDVSMPEMNGMEATRLIKAKLPEGGGFDPNDFVDEATGQ